MYEFEGRAPKVDPTAFIAPTAVLIGDVTVEAGASVWVNAVVRGDYAPVVIREGANVQDGSVQQVLTELREVTALCKVLGAYPRATGDAS